MSEQSSGPFRVPPPRWKQQIETTEGDYSWTEQEDIHEQMVQIWAQFERAWVPFAQELVTRVQAVCQALAPYLPKQKVVDRRRLAARRSRRRNERKAGILND